MSEIQEIKILGWVKAIHEGVNPPINKKMLWYNTNAGEFKHFYFDTVNQVWKPLHSDASDSNVNTKVKFFNLAINGSNLSIYTGQYAQSNFTLGSNEIGIFYQKIQNNDSDVYDGYEIYIFKKGTGIWGGGQNATNIDISDFIKIYKSQYSVDVFLGINSTELLQNSYLQFNNDINRVSTVIDYLKALHKTNATRLDDMRLSFSWSGNKDTNAGTERKKYSSRIQGNYTLLSVTFSDFDLLKQSNNKNGIVYTLLIDRFRNAEKKGSGVKWHRKSKFHHCKKNNLMGKINEIKITAETMILDFKQDFYFKPTAGKITDVKLFPAPTGSSTKRHQVNNYGKRGMDDKEIKRRTGWVDLAFRIRAEDTKTGRKIETKHLGFIRMLAVYEVSGIKSKHKRYITYSMRSN